MPRDGLIDAAWNKLGVQVTLDPVTNVDFSGMVFATGDYDVSPVTDFANPYQSTLTGLLAARSRPRHQRRSHHNPQYNGSAPRPRRHRPGRLPAVGTRRPARCTQSADMLPVSVLIINWVIKGARSRRRGPDRPDDHPAAGQLKRGAIDGRGHREVRRYNPGSVPGSPPGRLVVALAVVLSLSFLLVQLIPGDPVRLALGPTAPAPWSPSSGRPLA